ncbi:MAG: ATP-binding protein [Solirubrobacterales bacterium]
MAFARSEPFRDQVCPLGICEGDGWILGPEDVARPCDCRADRLRRSASRGVSSVIPRRFQGVSFDRPPISDMAREFQARAAVDAVRAYLDKLGENLAAGRGVWLFGDPGTGKTTLGMLVSKQALEQKHTVAIYSLPKLLARIRQSYDAGPDSDSYMELFRKLTTVDLLHIDDLGAEKRSDWVLEQLYALINERYETERAILVTTNLDEPELIEQIGRRTVSRLVEMCDGCMVPMHGEDRRLAA